jgi:hypothetical protein
MAGKKPHPPDGLGGPTPGDADSKPKKPKGKPRAKPRLDTPAGEH